MPAKKHAPLKVRICVVCGQGVWWSGQRMVAAHYNHSYGEVVEAQERRLNKRTPRKEVKHER